MAHLAGEEGPIAGINVTPLVDILLVVLIVFMATAPLLQRRAIKVDVPQAARHERAALEALTVAFSATREISLAGRTLSPEALSAELSRKVAASGGVQVTLAADRKIPYGEVVGLLDRIRAAGV
ncbi:MAG TPA: biopolymer transporter ExbD, partial [Elusimicrobiota bacterium]|nr:biopolymer transporter ExbD [Elusimicrobiota bacterium]